MKRNQLVDPYFFESIYKQAPTAAEGCKRVISVLREGLDNGKFNINQLSIRGLGYAIEAIDPYSPESSLGLVAESRFDSMYQREASVLNESNPGVSTHAFQIITGELVSRSVIAGYEDDSGWIGDNLCTVRPNQRLRNQRITGLTALAGPMEVAEGHPYSESDFEEKYVTTNETKKGRILSINEELILFDQVGEIDARARNFGYWCRQEREKTIVRGVVDADSTNNPVYRPQGVGEPLYSAANMNYIGSGGDTGYNSAVPLLDWTDIDHVLTYRATKVVDDRIDGDPEPIMGLNSRRNILLVPEAKRSTAWYITGQTGGEKRTNSSADITEFMGNPVNNFIGGVLSSPFLDSISSDDWYYGDFKKQFVWTEIYPVQTFVQGRDSDAAFDRDVVMRMKVRYYGGLSAVDSIFVTKVDGA